MTKKKRSRPTPHRREVTERRQRTRETAGLVALLGVVLLGQLGPADRR